MGVILSAHAAGDTVFVSGDEARNGTMAAIQKTGMIETYGTATANLDVVAWSGSVGVLSRFDLGAFQGGSACNVWGLITPGSPGAP